MTDSGNKIAAVVFDYGNVISRFDVTLFLKAVVPYSGLSPDGIIRQLEESRDLFIRYETGLVASESFRTTLTEQLRLSMSKERFIAAYTSIFEPVTETHALINRLRGRYRLAVLSNTSEWHFEHEIARSPVFPFFEAVTLSHVVGARKPDPKIYRDVLDKLDLRPESCAYVDDIAAFAEAATRLGMHGIHYTTPEKLVLSLTSLGVQAG